MDIVKNSDFGDILISNVETKKLFAFLKCQINCDIIFLKNNEKYFEVISLKNRLINGLAVNDGVLSYKDLLEQFADIMINGYSLNIVIDKTTYESKLSLITLIKNNNINPAILENCIYIDYKDKDSLFEIINPPQDNGNSDKLFYFEQNDTILSFSEQGPHLITDNINITSIIDVICVK